MSKWNHYTRREPVLRLLASLVPYMDTPSISRTIRLTLEGDIIHIEMDSRVGYINLPKVTLSRNATPLEKWIHNDVYYGANHITLMFGHHSLHVDVPYRNQYDAWSLSDYDGEVYMWKSVCYYTQPDMSRGQQICAQQ